MPIERQFLGFQQPALVTAARLLLDRYTANDVADLSPAVALVPGGRAGRRLLEVLLDESEQRDLSLVPPLVRTVGALPELLYEPQRPFADSLTQELAWSEALRSLAEPTLREFIAAPPAEDDAEAWLELGSLLSRQHAELAADGLDFSDVTRHTSEVDEPAESRRWDILRQVQVAYLARLDALGLWDAQTARLVAIERRECATASQLFLLGTVDLNRAMRQMLDQVADRVTALIHAPADWSDRFDEHGCLAPEVWEASQIDVDFNQVRVVADPTEQVETVARVIAGYEGRYAAEEITVGVPDESLVPQLERQLRQCNVPVRWGPGQDLRHTAPYRLLAAVADYLQRGGFAEFAALARHPDIDACLGSEQSTTDWLTPLDRYARDHLHARLDRRWLEQRKEYSTVLQVEQQIEKLLESLRAKPQPIGQWSKPITQFLLDVYGQRQLDRDHPRQRLTIAALEQLHAGLLALEAVPAELAPVMSVATTLRLALGRAAGQQIASPADEAAVELLGWLELPLDDAAALVVTSLNDGQVPKSANSDLFLPNTLRTRLGIEDNTRRYARDAYALSTLIASRPELTMIVGRRDHEGSPLAPSRLLLATEPDQLPARTLALFGEVPSAEKLAPLAGVFASSLPESDFPLVKPPPLEEPITSMSVTSFRLYRQCPYRFYLRNVLRLASLTDAVEELDGGMFGSLLHDVLNDFGRRELAEPLKDADELGEFLNAQLDQRVKRHFGAQPRAAVRLQVEQLRARLKVFADHQTHWAAKGWRVAYVESFDEQPQPAPFLVDGESMGLRGRIDRIDIRPETGEVAILDYKSSDTAKSPESTHRSKAEWIDLQLPLYRYLLSEIAEVESSDTPRLGYVLLPKDPAKAGFELADWDEATLASADEVAADVVRGVRQEIFWPPTDPPPDFMEEFAAICQDTVFEHRRDG